MEKGIHLLLDWYGCDDSKIAKASDLLNHLLQAAAHAKCRVVGQMAYQFEPQGCTAMVMLAESHITGHYSPEFSYIALDVYTCMNSMAPYKALEYLQQELKPTSSKINKQERG